MEDPFAFDEAGNPLLSIGSDGGTLFGGSPLALNAAVPPNPNSATPTRSAVFGGQSSGFADSTDILSRTFYSGSAIASADTVAKGMGESEIPRSIANKYALFNFQGFNGNLSTSQKDNYRDSANNPLMGGDRAHNVTIPKVLEYFSTTYPKISYQASDFLYSKYYKKIPVNHLVTLRRFPTPIQDNIYNLGVRIAPSTKEENGSIITNHTRTHNTSFRRKTCLSCCLACCRRYRR